MRLLKETLKYCFRMTFAIATFDSPFIGLKPILDIRRKIQILQGNDRIPGLDDKIPH